MKHYLIFFLFTSATTYPVIVNKVIVKNPDQTNINLFHDLHIPKTGLWSDTEQAQATALSETINSDHNSLLLIEFGNVNQENKLRNLLFGLTNVFTNLDSDRKEEIALFQPHMSIFECLIEKNELYKSYDPRKSISSFISYTKNIIDFFESMMQNSDISEEINISNLCIINDLLEIIEDTTIFDLLNRYEVKINKLQELDQANSGIFKSNLENIHAKLDLVKENINPELLNTNLREIIKSIVTYYAITLNKKINLEQKIDILKTLNLESSINWTKEKSEILLSLVNLMFENLVAYSDLEDLDLLDINYIYKILSNSQKNIYVVAGAGHCENIIRELQKLGYTKTLIFDEIPLNDKLTHAQSIIFEEMITKEVDFDIEVEIFKRLPEFGMTPLTIEQLISG